MNIRKTINKLQSALITKGYIYKINTYQFFSDQQNRMITGYRITQKQGKKDVELMNSCSKVEVLKWFVSQWEKHKNDGGSSEELSPKNGGQKKER